MSLCYILNLCNRLSFYWMQYWVKRKKPLELAVIDRSSSLSNRNIFAFLGGGSWADFFRPLGKCEFWDFPGYPAPGKVSFWRFPRVPRSAGGSRSQSPTAIAHSLLRRFLDATASLAFSQCTPVGGTRACNPYFSLCIPVFHFSLFILPPSVFQCFSPCGNPWFRRFCCFCCLLRGTWLRKLYFP